MWLPANAVARVRTTSLLGEKFVDLAAPTTEPPRGKLADGDRIPVARTSRATDVEEVLGALSLLFNGSGIDQIRTIATELNAGLARTAALLLTSHARLGWFLALGIAIGPILGYVLSRRPGLPDYTEGIGNWTESLGVTSLLLEVIMLILFAASLMRYRRTS